MPGPAPRDFTGFDFVVGSVFGQRVWKADAEGHLFGIVHDEEAWSPTENNARCAQSASYWWVFGRTGFGFTQTDRPMITPDDSDHIAECACGFYAYFADQKNTYANSMYMLGECPVYGVVEAYGKTVLGTKGFRASKARIAALCLPPYRDPIEDVKAWWLTRFIERHTDWHGLNGSLWTMGGSTLAILGLCLAPLLALAAWLAPLLVAMVALGIAVTWSSFKSIDCHFDMERARHWGPKDWTERYAKVRERYPDVPVYESVEAMLAAHPVTPPPPDVNE